MEGQVGNNIFAEKFNHGSKDKYYGYGTYVAKNPSNNNIINNTDNPSKPVSQIDAFLGDLKIRRKKKKKKEIIWGSSIVLATSTLIVSSLVMLLNKGRAPKSLSKMLNSGVNKLTEKIDKVKQKTNLSEYEHIYLGVLQKTQKGLESVLGAVLNLSLKDVFFNRFFRKTLKMNKTCDKITGFFEKMAVKMVLGNYKKAEKAASVMHETFSEANKYILKNRDPHEIVTIGGIEKTVEEWLSTTSGKSQNVKTYSKYYSANNFNKRHQWLNDKLKDLPDRIYNHTFGDMGHFVKSPKRWTTFISEAFTQPTKTTFENSITSVRRQITNTPKDVSKEFDTIIGEIQSNLDLSDKPSLDVLKQIKKVASSYSGETGFKSPEEKTAMLDAVSDIMNKLTELVNKDEIKCSAGESKEINKSLARFNRIIKRDKKGEVEDLLDIYDALLPKEQMIKVKKSADNMTKILKNATDVESDNFVDKIRDLRTGAAITDVSVGLLVPVISTGIAMSTADTKEKRRSVLLNYGVPLLTGVATSMMCTLKLIAGGGALVAGVASGAIVNEICGRLDNHLKKTDKFKASTAETNQSVKT